MSESTPIPAGPSPTAVEGAAPSAGSPPPPAVEDPPQATGPSATPPRRIRQRARVARPEELLDQWLASLDTSSEPRISSQPRTQAVSEAPLALRLAPGVVEHEGSLTTRGATPSLRALCRELGATSAEERALDVVAAFFGDPFDAARADVGGVVSWGFFRLTGPLLASALASWKRARPEAFRRVLVSQGVDVLTREVGGPPYLVVEHRHDEQIGAPGSLMRIVCALAHAGRDEGARAAQVKVVLRRVLTAVLDSSPPEQGWSPDAAPRTPHNIAARLYLYLTIGLPGAAMATAILESCKSHDLGIDRLADELSGQLPERCIHDLRRLLSSPELGARERVNHGTVHA